jgi:effector-binding domain-containing protein
MKVLKKIIVALLILAVLVVVVSLFMPSEVKVSRTVVINAPIEVVYAQANNLNNFHAWDPWGKIDPNAAFVINETYAGVGASMSWKSDDANLGNGMMTIVESVPFEKVNTDIAMDGEPMGNGGFIFEGVAGGTKVQWWMSMDMGMNPIGRIMGNFMDAMIGPMFEQGLAEMGARAEAAELVGDYTTAQAMRCVTMRRNIAIDEMSTIHAVLYGEIMSYLTKNNVEMAGMPMAIYHSYSADMVDIEYGIPVAAEVMPTDEINVIDMPTQAVVKFIHMGDYADLSTTYEKAEAWMTENGIDATGAPWEVYVTDSEVETDVTKWETAVYFPVN